MASENAETSEKSGAGVLSSAAPVRHSSAGAVAMTASAMFTGEVVEHAGEALVSLDVYEHGLRHGPSREWYKDSALRSEGRARGGVLLVISGIGTRTMSSPQNGPSLRTG